MPAPVVLLYGRPGCSLCVQALGMLRRLAPRFGFTVQEVDIESDDALLRRFVFEIPVVAVGETVLARAPIYEAALQDALAEALAR